MFPVIKRRIVCSPAESSIVTRRLVSQAALIPSLVLK